ncbi:MAG: hypothetical protein Q7K42_04610 [Candidatus Diapherotrites archaeon]|nr:hypothetical protein [Candidatus Diapherotrites archaeon]
MRFLKSSKAFIGPIGDDLPSLIPIIFSLLIFFSAFTFAFNKFNEENDLIRTKLDALNVARTMKVNSFISNYEHFQKLCEDAKVVQINFIAGLVELNLSDQEQDSSAGLNFLKIPEKNQTFACYSSIFDDQSPEEIKIPTNRQVLNLTYPIALQNETIVIPAHLVIRAWK